MSAVLIAAIVLAAGNSARMGASNKLLIAWEGELLVRRALRAARDAGIDDIIVVVPTRDDEVIRALHGLPVRIVENANHAQGIASSIRAGIGALGPAHAGVLVVLADMPLIAARHIFPLLEAFAAAKNGSCVIVPYHRGRRGNPVLWGRDHFNELMHLSGDVGARVMLERHANRVVRVEIDDDAVLVDVDSPQDWARLNTASTS